MRNTGRRGWSLGQVAIAIVGSFLLLVAVLFLVAAALDDDDNGDEASVGLPGQETSGFPEFVDAFPPEPPSGGGDAGDARNACSRQERISWGDAGNYLNQRVAVLGPVDSISERPDGAVEMTLGTTEDATPVTVVITSTALERLPSSPQQLYGGEVICVIGVLVNTNGAIELQVNEPADIAVI